MPLVTLQQILSESEDKAYAVPSLGADNHLLFEAYLRSAEELNRPVIVMVPGFLIPLIDPDRFFSYARQRIEQSPVPVCLHLDHAVNLEEIMSGIKHGFSSVMIDGSALPFDHNVAITRKVVELAHACGISVEAEIGHVGGAEGNDNLGNEVDRDAFTDPSEAKRFLDETGVDALAVAFGTVHGVYKGTPKLDLERLDAIRAVVDVPLVMHGGSGLSDDDFRAAVSHGIRKINFVTGLFLSTTEAARAAIDSKGGRMHLPQVLGVASSKARDETAHLFDVYNTQTLDLPRTFA